MNSLLILLAVTNVFWPGGEYIDSNHFFRLTVPPSYRVRTGMEKASDSYIPVCHADSTVCFEYPPNRFKGTTFSSSSVEVTRFSATTKEGCIDDPGQLDRSQPTRVIDGIKFQHTLDGQGVMSHNIEFSRYWGFDKSRCFELAIAITYTNSAAYDPGQIKQFTKRDQEKVTSELNKIVDSFHALE